jgi:hypothetical protein
MAAAASVEPAKAIQAVTFVGELAEAAAERPVARALAVQESASAVDELVALTEGSI